MPTRPSPTAVGLVAAAALLVSLVALVLAPTPAAATVPAGLRVSGNTLVTGSGAQVVLRGVDRSGTEYHCIHGYGIFDGPSDDASIAAMASWKINAVRVPLNEDCWLGINGAPAAYSGANYRNAIADYVDRLHDAGLVAILDLHWTAAGTAQSAGQQNMPDADHAGAFWTSVATTFRADTSTVLDLFNEPHDVSWTCWRDGGDCGLGYQVAGMQSLLDAVRATGATNPVLVGGLAYANDLSGWLQYRPSDPTGNLMASWHSYNFNACSTVSCWNTRIAPVAAAVPVVTGEVGENDCGRGYLDTVLPWLDSHRVGYLGWGWNTFDCSGFPSLITDYATGAPTAYGVGLRDHLASLSTTPPTSTPPTTTPPTTTPPTTTPPTTTPTTPPPPGGRLPATGTAQTGSAPYWWENDLDLTMPGTTTALSVTITVKGTPGVATYGFDATAAKGLLTLKRLPGANLVYRATLRAGQTLPSGYQVRFGAQYSGNGTAHAINGDTYQVKATVGGRVLTATGHF